MPPQFNLKPAYSQWNPLFFLNFFPRQFKRLLLTYVACCSCGFAFFMYTGYLSSIFTFVMLTLKANLKPSHGLVSYFPDLHNDASRISWYHAANSQNELKIALASKTLMIEADILQEGRGTSKQSMTAIMAHPPAVTSDLTFTDFLHHVGLDKQRQLGIKLDFKDSSIIDLCLQQLKKAAFNGPVLINADILQGPGSSLDVIPINHSLFLRLFSEYSSKYILSVGWTTGYSDNARGYSWDHVFNMYSLIDEYFLSQKKPLMVTYPVRASLLGLGSFHKLRWLMEVTKGSLTVWTAKADSTEVGPLVTYRASLPRDKVMFDVPHLTSKQTNELFSAMYDEDKLKPFSYVESSAGDILYKEHQIRESAWSLIPSDNCKHALSQSALVMKGPHLVLVSSALFQPSEKAAVIVQGDFNPSLDGHLSVVVNSHGLSEAGLKLRSGQQFTVHHSGLLVLESFTDGKSVRKQQHTLRGEGLCFVYKVEHNPTFVSVTVEAFTGCLSAVPHSADKATLLVPSTGDFSYRPTVKIISPNAASAVRFLSINV